MACVFRIIGLATGQPSEMDGQFLKSYDPEAFDGRGEATGTNKLREALRVENIGAALELLRRQPVARPLRADGLPNRPITAFTIEILAEEQA